MTEPRDAKHAERPAGAAWPPPAGNRQLATQGGGDGAVVILPRLRADDVGDALVSLGTGVVIALELLVLPALVYAAVGRGSEAGLIAALAVFVAEALAAAFTGVHWLKLDARGIHFGRRMGFPRFVPWQDVARVRRAGRAEIVVRGWLWPPVPPAEATRSMSSLGHFAIHHPHGVSYFPPADEAAFLDAVRRWAPHALDRIDGGLR
ncbi:MAG TPA: hypothetical protein VF092_24655 [Longimicrobium sp.]